MKEVNKIREKWEHPAPKDQNYIQEQFQGIRKELIQMVVRSAMQGSVPNINTSSEGADVMASIGCYEQAPSRKIEIRSRGDASFELRLTCYEEGQGLVSINHLISPSELKLIPESLRIQMLQARNEQSSNSGQRPGMAG